jgi:hypothetical protein
MKIKLIRDRERPMLWLSKKFYPLNYRQKETHELEIQSKV